MRAFRLAVLPLLVPVASVPVVHHSNALPAAAANDNRRPAGHLVNGAITLTLETRVTVWHPLRAASDTVYAFSEAGGVPMIPGPLVRVRQGTMLDITVRNTLPTQLIMHGFATTPITDPLDRDVKIPAGSEHRFHFVAGAPGTYTYWANAGDSSTYDREDKDSQLGGVIVIDPAKGAVPPDRIFTITQADLPPDTTPDHAWTDRFMVAINGRSAPETEPLTYQQGDSIRWRIVNLGWETHPMHLHGFFFRIESHGDGRVDTALAARQHLAVTQMMDPGTTMYMAWHADRPGNWLFHCHIAAHASAWLTGTPVGWPMKKDSTNTWVITSDTTSFIRDQMHAMMAGLILDVSIKPKHGAFTIDTVAAQNARLVIAPLSSTGLPSARYGVSVTDASGGDTTSHAAGRPLVLTRGVRTRIRVVNRMQYPMTMHWHGVELESYFDGVANWSGDAKTMMHPIAPGDSFVAYMTPPRNGTYIYHAHMEADDIMGGGVYGALLVVPDAKSWSSAHDRSFVVGGNPETPAIPYFVNGSKDSAAAPITMHAGESMHMRFVDIMDNHNIFWSFVPVADTTDTLRWTPVGKDGADLPAALQAPVKAAQRLGPGETYDFTIAPASPGRYALRGRNKTGKKQWVQWIDVAP